MTSHACNQTCMRRIRAHILRGHLPHLPRVLDYIIVNHKQMSRIAIRRHYRASMVGGQTRNAARSLPVHRSMAYMKQRPDDVRFKQVHADGRLSRGSSVTTERACSRLSDRTDRVCSRMSDLTQEEISEPGTPSALIDGPSMWPSKSLLPEPRVTTSAGRQAEERLHCLRSKHAGYNLNFGSWEGVPKDKLQLSRRSLIVQFIDHLRDDFCLDPEVTTFAVSYLDRFLCNVASRGGFEQHRTELLGLVCLMLASKFKEVMSPSIDGLLQSVRTKYTREDFKAMEVEVLVTLGWSLDSPSPLAALQHLLVALSEHCGKDFSIIGNHALLCVELASWEPKIVQYPAVVIAAAGLLASWTLSNADVPSSIGMHVLCELCRISRVDLVRCEALMIDLVKRSSSHKNSQCASGLTYAGQP